MINWTKKAAASSGGKDIPNPQNVRRWRESEMYSLSLDGPIARCSTTWYKESRKVVFRKGRNEDTQEKSRGKQQNYVNAVWSCTCPVWGGCPSWAGLPQFGSSAPWVGHPRIPQRTELRKEKGTRQQLRASFTTSSIIFLLRVQPCPNNSEIKKIKNLKAQGHQNQINNRGGSYLAIN